MNRYLSAYLLCLLWLMGLVSCQTAAPTSEPKPTIRLIVNPWPASELNVAVAKQLIEKELGYPVKVLNIDSQAQWAALANDQADASLEIWPSGHGENIAQYIDTEKVVEHGGALGPKGIIGWYVPKYVVEAHPELASWEGYQDVNLTRLFATPKTGERGQFLAGDPTWTQYDADIILNLGLNLEVVSAGSEKDLLAAVDSAYKQDQPILFYFYEPHAIFAKYDLVQVSLPEYTSECYANPQGGSVNCAYPVDELLKIFSVSLAHRAPDVHQLLKAFNYDNQAQVEMLANLESGKTVEQAAADWIETHPEVWQKWLP